MKKIVLLIVTLLIFTACKKDKVDATSTMAFQSSINDMASSLTTIEQIKFNESLYILKTFGVEADGDSNELKALGKLLSGKKVPEILSMADKVAQDNGITWSSTAPPSLGDMNIFGDTTAKEHDQNDIKANGVSIVLNPSAEETATASSIQIMPRLVDAAGNPIKFSGAALETTLEVLSNGVRLFSAKNLMQDNNFKGFTLRLNTLPAQKVVDNKIDVRVSVKTTAKTHVFTKMGIDVNPGALKVPAPAVNDTTATPTSPSEVVSNPGDKTPTKPVADPKTTVSKFLGNISAQNLKAAYENSDNSNWGSYDNFANPTSGFGSVKSLNVKNITTTNTSPNSATVNATYDVTDKNGNTSALKVTFGLKQVNGEWKISSYKIN